MAINGKPEIFGPDADKVELEHVPDGTGFSGETAEQPAGLAEEIIAEIFKEQEEDEIAMDPMYPFGRPENIDYAELDQAGIQLIQEVNLRPWMKSVEYCSGHPLNRPPDEPSYLYPFVSGENVYEEINRLDLAHIRGLIPDPYFRYRKQELRQQGMTRFYLNVNVFNMMIFQEWARIFSTLVTVATQSSVNPLIARFNPLRPGINYSFYWDYWTVEERQLIHAVALDALSNFPL